MDRLEKFKRSAKRQEHRLAPLLERKRMDKDAFAMAMMRKRLFDDLKALEPRIEISSENAATTAPRVINRNTTSTTLYNYHDVTASTSACIW